MIVSMLLNGLWQGAPLVAVTYLVSHLVSERNAATRYALWFAALAAIVVVPVLTTGSNLGALALDALRPHTAAASYVISLIPTGTFARETGGWLPRLAPWMLALWLAGAGVNLVRLGASFVRIAGIRREARPAGGADCDIYISDAIAVPIVAGIFAPRIVIPCELLAELTSADLQSIVHHERAHVRRNDCVWNFAAQLIEALFFFNPWIRIAGKHVAEEREAACDDWVVAEVGRADEYAACLAALAQKTLYRGAPLLTPSVVRSRHALVSRIERLSSTHSRHLTVNTFAVGGTIVIFIALTLAVATFAPALALSPPGAQQLSPSSRALLAAACTQPDADARVVTPVMPDVPHGLKMHATVEVGVTVAPNGKVTRASIVHSSGNEAIDRAVVEAAMHSTYSPKLVNCTPVQGSYLFRADFAPSN
jgi:TonB family protein